MMPGRDEGLGQAIPLASATFSHRCLIILELFLPCLGAGAAVGIFFLGFCLGGITEFGGERAVRRFAQVRQYRRRENEWFRAGSEPDLRAQLLESESEKVRHRMTSRSGHFTVVFHGFSWVFMVFHHEEGPISRGDRAFFKTL